MVPGFSLIVGKGLALLSVGVVLFTVELATIVYFIKRVRGRSCSRGRAPARAAANLLIWCGRKLVRALLRAAQPLFEMLSEASAELSERVLGKRSARVEAAVCSRLRR